MIISITIIILGLWLPCPFVIAGRNSEGRNFAITFAAVRSDGSDGYSHMYVNAKNDTSITVTMGSTSTDYDIDSSSVDVFKLSVSTVYRTLEGLENKVIYVTANDANITITLTNYRSFSFYVAETILALPKDETPNEFYVMNYPNDYETTCSGGSTVSFYSVAAYEDDTVFQVYEPTNEGYVLRQELVIQPGKVFTERSLKASSNNFEATGFKITSDKAVSVTGGNSCLDLHTSAASATETIWSSMPKVSDAGLKYISNPVITNAQGMHPYILRVLALSDDTAVTLRKSDSGTTINAGQFYSYNDVPMEPFAEEVIECSKPCIVAQYGIADNSGIFMAILPPTTNYVTNVKFTTPATDGISTSVLDHFISIILLSDSPTSSGMTLDGNDLSGNVNWVTINEYSYLVYEITGPEEQVHELVSNVPFSCLVNGHMGSSGQNGHGYGFIAGLSGNSDDSGPEPERNITLPQYEITMTGTFQSTDGEDYSQSCTVQYSVEMTNKAASMIPEVNSRIGSQLCSGYTAEDIKLASASTILQTNGDSGNTKLWYYMVMDSSTITGADVEACASEIGTFLLDHSNWEEPILPTQPGCPGVQFSSRFFNDSGNSWICGNNLDNTRDNQEDAIKKNTPRFVLIHTGYFSTEDDTDISPDCLSGYGQNFQSSTFNQFQTINSMIGNGELCVNGDVSIETAAANIASQSNVGQTFQDYVFYRGAATSYEDMYACADEVSEYLKPHTNWVQPIIPAPIGCPQPIFNPENFNENKKEWIC